MASFFGAWGFGSAMGPVSGLGVREGMRHAIMAHLGPRAKAVGPVSLPIAKPCSNGKR